MSSSRLNIRKTRPRLGRLLGLLMLVLTIAGASGAARAADLLEPPRQRQGYYFAFGYHLVLSHAWENKESWGLWKGGSLSIRFGQLITRRFGMGLQINSGSVSGEGQQMALGGLELEAQWEIAHNLGLHGGVGLDIVSISSTNGKDKSTRGTVGSGYSLGLGYDLFLGHRMTGGWAATPTITARYVPGNTASALEGLIGVQLTYWTGLPRNQLDLPPGEAFQKQ